MKFNNNTPTKVKLLLETFTKEQLAVRFQISVRTIERWRDGDFEPHHRDKKRLDRMIDHLMEKSSLIPIKGKAKA